MQKELILFNSTDGNVYVDVTLEKETLWLSQKQMAEIFGKDTDTISLHLKNIYQDGELIEEATTEFFSVVQIEGNRTITRKIKFYSLDAIISVGYRVNSKQGTQFRIWANQILKDYLSKGYAPISHALRGESPLILSPKLGWTHYRALMRVKRPEARRFYEIEAENNNWTSRALERQINTLLYDRLAKSKDKAGLIRLITKGQEINKPEDAIKEPMVLEFLNIPESNKLVESKLEEALISNLQHFLLELGKGFAFVARQKRLTLDGKHYRCDLVFYHVIPRDIKMLLYCGH